MPVNCKPVNKPYHINSSGRAHQIAVRVVLPPDVIFSSLYMDALSRFPRGIIFN